VKLRNQARRVNKSSFSFRWFNAAGCDRHPIRLYAQNERNILLINSNLKTTTESSLLETPHALGELGRCWILNWNPTPYETHQSWGACLLSHDFEHIR
jgi:hypothetical protein